MPDLADPIEEAKARILARQAQAAGGDEPIEKGTLDPLAPRKILKNPDGSISTTSSSSFEEDGKEVLIPTVVDGVRLSNEDAWAHYKATGQHFGKFKDAASADRYANRMHDQQTDAMGLPRGNAAPSNDPIEQAKQRILDKPMDLATKKAVLRRLYGGNSPGEVNLDYEDKGKPLTEREAMAQAEQYGTPIDRRTPYQRTIDQTLEKAVPGARTIGHAKRIMDAIPEEEPSTFGEKATAVVGEFNRSFAAPAVGMQKLAFKAFGQEVPEPMARAAELFGTGDDNPRIAKARQALSESTGGRFALGAAGLAGALPGIQALGGGAGGMALQAFEASGGDVSAAGEAYLFGKLGTGASKVFDAWLAKLPVAARSIAVSRGLSAGSGGAAFIVTNAILHGFDPEQALQDGLLGTGMSLAHGGGKDLNARAKGIQQTRDMPTGRMALPQGELPPPDAARGPIIGTDPTIPEGRRLEAGRQGAALPPDSIIPGESSERLPALPASTRGVPVTPFPPLTPEMLSEYRRTGKFPVSEYAGASATEPYSAPRREWTTVEPPKREAERPPPVSFKNSREAPYGVERPQEPVQANPPPDVRPEYSVERPLGNAGLEDVQASDARRKGLGYAEPTKPDGKPLDRVSATFSDTGEATPESQRGAVSLGKPDLSELRGMGGKTKDFILNDTIRPIAKIAPELHAVMGEGSNFKESAHADAELADRRIRHGIDKKTVSRAEMLALENELRGNNATLRGNRAFDKAFPNEAAVLAGAKDPKILEVINRFMVEHAPVEQENVAAGAKLAPPTNKLFPGLRLNLVARTAKEAGIKGLIGKGSNVRLTGPSIQPTEFAKVRTGHAKYGYDASFKRQIREAFTEARDTRRKLDAIEVGSRNGVIVPFDKKVSANPKYEGWSLYSAGIRGDLTPLKPEQLGPNTSGVYLVHPDVASPLKTWLGLNETPFEHGLGMAASRLTTRLSTSGLAEATAHAGGNLSSGAIRAGNYYGADVLPRAASYALPEGKTRYYEDMKRLTKYGAAKGEYDRTGLGKLTSPASAALDRIDVATRISILNHIESEIASGRAPDTYETRRNGILQVGNYNNLTTDYLTRFIKAIPFGNVFATAGKTAIPNAVRLLGMSSGIEAASGKARAIQAAKIAVGVWGSYLAAAAVHNISKTGDPFPEGMPWWGLAGDIDPKTGKREYSVAIARLMGIDTALRVTGLGAFTDAKIHHGLSWGESLKRMGMDIAKKQLNVYTGGPLTRVVEGFAKGQKPSDIASNAIPLWEAIAKGREYGEEGVFDSQFGAFKTRLGESPKSLDKIRSGQKDYEAERRAAAKKAQGK